VNVDPGQVFYPSLEDIAVVMNLREFTPVGWRAPGW